MMLKRSERNLIVGLDIGTSKVVALVGEIAADGSIELLGLGSQPSRGLKKGVVVNIESTVQSIQRAVEEAELMAGCEIHSVYAGIAGSHVRSLNSHGVVGVRDKEVSHGDVEHASDHAHPHARDDQSVADHRHLAQLAHRQDRRLRRVDDRGEAGHAVHPEVGHRERGPRQFGRRDRALANSIGERARVARDLEQ